MLNIKFFVLFCKYFFKVSEGPSFALHKETGEGGQKNYIVQLLKENVTLLIFSAEKNFEYASN